MAPDDIYGLTLGFENFFQAAPCFLTVQGPDLRIIAANDEFIERFGDARGRFGHEIYKTGVGEGAENPVETTFADGRTHISEQRAMLPDGSEIPIVAFTSPVRGPSGTIEAVVQISADITLVKRLESQLRESRERFRLLFEESPCYISVQDRDLCIVEANRRFKEAFGDFEGAPCFEVYKHRDAQCTHCPVLETFHDGKSHRSEEVVTSLSGKQMNMLVFTAPIYDTQGEIEMVMEMSTDITRIRALQDQLTNLGLYVGSISHGLKGLLTGLDGGMYLLNTGLEKKKPERVEEGLRMVQRNVGHIRRVVLDLLNIAGEGEPQFDAVGLYELAESLAEKLKKRAGDLEIDFQVELGCRGETIEIDRRALKGCLLNILENAFEACRLDRTKKDHLVRFRLTSEDIDAVFLIEDNGLGMDRETREKMFSLSFDSAGSKGPGLGLFTANKVIEKHGGIIEVESEPDQGTTFQIRIPKVRSAT
jgi:PAS domain S-box-containing protein